MTDKKQLVLPPGSSRLPATAPRPTPSLPSLFAGTATFGTVVGVYERNTRQVAASANYMRARADQAAACTELIQKREELAVAISRLSWLDLRCEHEFEKGKLSMHNELQCMKLEHELSQTNLQIQVAQARFSLAQYQPQPEAPPPPPPPPTPDGLTPTEVEAVLQRFPDVKPELIEPIVMILRGMMAEKKS